MDKRKRQEPDTGEVVAMVIDETVAEPITAPIAKVPEEGERLFTVDDFARAKSELFLAYAATEKLAHARHQKRSATEWKTRYNEWLTQQR